MKTICSTLRLALVLASLSFGLNASAADSPVLKPQKQTIQHQSDNLGTSYMIDHVVSYGKITMALSHKPGSFNDSKQVLGKIADGPSWKVIAASPGSSVAGCLSLFRPTGDQMTPALIQLTDKTIAGLGLKPDSEVTFLLGKDGFYLTTSSGDKHLILTSKEIQTAQTKITGASGLAAATSKPAGQ